LIAPLEANVDAPACVHRTLLMSYDTRTSYAAVDVEGSSLSLSIPRAKSVTFGLYSQKVWYNRATYRDSVQMRLLVVYPPLCLHTCFGSFTATHNPMHTTMNSTTYTRFPPKCYSSRKTRKANPQQLAQTCAEPRPQSVRGLSACLRIACSGSQN